jgi:hypothetical protein
LEKIERTTLGLPRMALVLPQLLLDRGEHLRLHEGGDRDGHPLLLGHIDGRDGPARPEGTPALRPQPWTERFLTGLAKRRRPQIRGIL